jgi:hypothetical protein
MEPEGLLPCSQGPAMTFLDNTNCLVAEPEGSTPLIPTRHWTRFWASPSSSDSYSQSVSQSVSQSSVCPCSE